MALTINKGESGTATGPYVIAQERMFLTADRSRVVPEGDPEAASLYAAPGHRIPAAAAEQFDLAGGKVPVKLAPKPADKRRKGASDKKG